MTKHKYQIVIEFEVEHTSLAGVPSLVLDEVVDACSVQLESLSDGDISLDYPHTLTSATWSCLE